MVGLVYKIYMEAHTLDKNYKTEYNLLSMEKDKINESLLAENDRIYVANDFAGIVSDVLSKEPDMYGTLVLASFAGVIPDKEIRREALNQISERLGDSFDDEPEIHEHAYSKEAHFAYMGKDVYYLFEKILRLSPSDNVRRAVIANSDCSNIPELTALLDALAKNSTNILKGVNKENRSQESQDPEILYPAKDIAHLVVDLCGRYHEDVAIENALNLANIIRVPEIRRVVYAYLSDIYGVDIEEQEIVNISKYEPEVIYRNKDEAYRAVKGLSHFNVFDVGEIFQVVSDILQKQTS